uniref:Integrase, catalytic region, zinc finger, CCHC-type, peptidase aspartic, catalytic n=1 Tax=Tanacetum cinerariifolium TaxID=118510 RepID=A0A6L2MYJ1_TANCI|nr:integrase, catalytic region, zinc finger, CCHC-type, peptidase aspartic, catalytic [Tanacetum cinerariifolium]
MFKLDLKPLAPRLLQNRKIHLEFLKNTQVVQIVLSYLDSGCSKYMTGKRSQLINFVSKFLGTVRFGNDHIARIMGYGDYQMGNVTILRVYYVEGLRHNLYSIGLFCDANLEVAFQKNTCFIRNLEGVYLISGSRDINLYTVSLDDMLKTSLICLLSKAFKTKSWLWYRQLSHLNFVTATPRAIDLADSPVSMSIDQDAPSTSIQSTQEQEHSPIISQGFEESPKTPSFRDDLLHESLHEDSNSQGSSSNVTQIHTPFEHLGRWTKDHPIANVIGDPSRSVSTKKQLQTDAMWCYFDAFLTSDNLSHVYKLKKALCGLKQAPCAWYDMLSSFLISQRLSKGAVDPTLFTQKAGNNLLLAKPTEKQLNAVKRIFQYIKGTINMGLWYSKDTSDKLVSWSSKKQKSTTILSIEAEYIALSKWCAQIIWMRSQVENGIVELYFVRTEYQLADIFTKPMPRERFNFLIEKLEMRSMSLETLKHLAEETDE